jgi:hypothetical protein
VAFDTGVEAATALDDAAFRAAIALNGPGVGVVVGISWRVAGVPAGAAIAIGEGLSWRVVTAVVELAVMVDGVAVAIDATASGVELA